jgi:hypothetical protein
LEIFAGNGYLAAQLLAQDVGVLPTTVFSSHDNHAAGCYCKVEELGASEAVARYGKKHEVLLVCWPTVTLDVLKAAQVWGPDKDIVFIGEVTDYSKNHLGGCATDEFFDAIQFLKTFDTYQGNMLEAAGVCRLKP